MTIGNVGMFGSQRQSGFFGGIQRDIGRVVVSAGIFAALAESEFEEPRGDLIVLFVRRLRCQRYREVCHVLCELLGVLVALMCQLFFCAINQVTNTRTRGDIR